MGAFRFLHRWPAIVPSGSPMEGSVPLLDDRDRELEDYLDSTPLGILDVATVTANQGSITGATDLTDLTVTVNVQAGRSIRVAAVAQSLNSGANSNLLYIKEDGTTKQTSRYVASTVAESFPGAWVILAPTAGEHTYKLTGDVGGGTMTLVASSSSPAQLVVEDIGRSV